MKHYTHQLFRGLLTSSSRGLLSSSSRGLTAGSRLFCFKVIFWTPRSSRGVTREGTLRSSRGVMVGVSCIKRILFFILLVVANHCVAWDMNGHKIVATIAYDRLTPAAKAQVNKLTKIDDVGTYSGYVRFLRASFWPDWIKWQDVTAFNDWHYINLPYTQDGIVAPPLGTENVVWAIQQSEQILSSKKPPIYLKAMFLRFLIHFVGDIHQPLHCIMLYNKQFPDGDQGGNLFIIQNRYAKNLHQYWDQGAGLFRAIGGKPKLGYRAINHIVRMIEHKYPPSYFGARINQPNPMEWAQESYHIAKKVAYNLKEGSAPSPAYTAKARQVVEQRLALAGYRLAVVLNKIW